MSAAYDDRSDLALEWELTPQNLALFSSYVNQGGAEETSYNDLFDDGAYRAAQASFNAQAHSLTPRGQTYYRGRDEQGLSTVLGFSARRERPPVLNVEPLAGYRLAAVPIRAKTRIQPNNNSPARSAVCRPVPPAGGVPGAARTFHSAG